MSQRTPRRSAPRAVFVLPARLLGGIIVALSAAMLLLTVIASGTLARVAGGAVVADRATVAVQQSAAERDLDVGYGAAVDQVRKARALHLAIPTQQADTIANKALTDLATLRHSALLSLSQQLGASADAAEGYARSTEQAIDARRGQPQPSAAAVLLAPRLYAIVSRFNELATQIADQATTDLTQSPPASPTPSPTATPRPAATPTPTPTR